MRSKRSEHRPAAVQSVGQRRCPLRGSCTPGPSAKCQVQSGGLGICALLVLFDCASAIVGVRALGSEIECVPSSFFIAELWPDVRFPSLPPGIPRSPLNSTDHAQRSHSHELIRGVQKLHAAPIKTLPLWIVTFLQRSHPAQNARAS